jgi:hypothetical protein
MRVRSVTVAVSAVLVLAGPMTACGGDSASPELNASAPDTLVLRAQELRSGPAPWELGQLPAFSLYGGGRVLVAGNPAGALQQARDFQLPAPEFEQLVADAGAAGLGQARTYEDTDSTDASLLVVSLRTTDGIRTTRIAEPEAQGARSPRRVAEYVKRLPSAPREAHEFQPTALAVLATSGVSKGSTAAVPWPMRPLAEGIRTRQGMCTLVTGGELTEAMRLAASAEQQTRWSSGGKLYAVSFRPLLPDEHTCGDVDFR